MRTALMLSLLALTGCATNSNNPVATYKAAGQMYEVTLTGKRANMAHDPVSMLFRGTSPTSITLKIPRITGEVLGSEIPTEKGDYRFAGKLDIFGEKMTVDLSYDDTDRGQLRPTSWNGLYILKVAQ